MKRRSLIRAAAAASRAWLAGTASAQPRTLVVDGDSALAGFATVLVAADQGLFARRGLDLEPYFIPLKPPDFLRPRRELNDTLGHGPG